MTREEELLEFLKRHEELYELGVPQISDPEYDAFLLEYEKLSGKKYNRKMPNVLISELEKYKHPYNILSLGKVYTIFDAVEEAKKLWPIIVEPKLDGLTVCEYEGIHFITRGGGDIGESITHNAKNMKGIGESSDEYDIRGEAVILKEDFDSCNAIRIENNELAYKNRRNGASGALRKKEVNESSKYVTFITYDIMNSNLKPSDQVKTLQELGYETVPYWKFNTLEEFKKFLEEFDKDSLPYDIDGLVIKSDISNALEKFGTTNHHPKHSVAYKFPAEGKWATVKDVIWQVGRTGACTPVLEFSPTELLDTIVTRATSHNYVQFKALMVSKGCEVFVIKSGDVIPYAERTQKYNPFMAFKIPTHCPECNTLLVKEESTLRCTNDLCKARLAGNIAHLASKKAMNIEGLSISTAEKIIEYHKNVMRTPFDIFFLSKESILVLDGFAEKSANNLYTRLQKAKNGTEYKRFLISLCIPQLGEDASKRISEVYTHVDDLIEELETNDGINLLEIENIGEKTVESLVLNIDILKQARNTIKIVYEETTTIKVKEQFTIMVTGSFTKNGAKYSRTAIQEYIESKGHVFSKTLTKSVTHALIGEAAGSKAGKAEETLSSDKILRNIEELEELI